MRLLKHRSRASVYILTLSCAMLVALIGVTAILTMQSQGRAVAATTDAAAARAVAQSAVELGLYMTDRVSDWRTNLSAGYWYEDQPLGNGMFDLHVDDPEDGDLSDSLCDSVTLTGEGRQNDARYILQVTLRSDAVDFDPLPAILAEHEPISYWRLGDTDTTVAADAAELQAGVYQNGVTNGVAVPFRCDTAAYFDGYNDFVEIPHVDDYLIDEGTISLWMKPANTWYSQGLISKDSRDLDTGGHFYLELEQGWVSVRLQSAKSSYGLTAWRYLYADEWYHVAVTFGPDGLQLYIDGVLLNRNSYEGGLGTSSGGAGNYEPWAIGVNTSRSEDKSTVGWDNPFRGLIDEVVIIGEQLDDDEIELLYDAGVSQPDWTMRIVPGSWRRVVD